MSENETSPYREWLNTNMDVMPDGLGISCRTHGPLLRWEPGEQPSMSKMEIKVIFHMAAEHGEDYDRLKPADW